MFEQIEEAGKRHLMIGNITYHWFDELAVKSQDALVTTSSDIKRRSQTMKEISLCIKWSYGNTTWVALKDIKETYPVQLAE